MKLLHLSDTHLGHGGFGLGAMLEDPMRPGIMARQREYDIRAGLTAAVDVALEQSVDVVIHSGDLFDSARPPAYAVDFAMGEIKRLATAGVPVILVEGNNSYPRDRALGHPLQILAHLAGVTVVCEEPTEVRTGSWVIHAYPHRAVQTGRWPERLPKGAKTDGHILVSHGVADGLPFFRGDRPAPMLAVARVAPWFTYVGVGHYHRHAQIPDTENAFYAGSTAMVGWSDHRPGHAFSVTLLDTEAEINSVPIPLPTRAMRSYGLDNAEGLDRGEILERLSRQASALPPAGANCLVVVDRLDPMVSRDLSRHEVEEVFRGSSALQLSLRAREQRWEAVRAGLAGLGRLSDRFKQLVEASEGDADFKRAVAEVGDAMLEAADERVAQEEAGEGAREAI